MRDMVPLSYSEGRKLLHVYPEDWDGLIKFCEDFENAPHPGSEQGNLCANALYDFFAFQFFPRPLHWLGRSILIALSLPTTLKAHKIKPVNPLLSAVIIWILGWLFWLQDNVFPDPQISFFEEQQSMSPNEQALRMQTIRKVDKEYTTYFTSRHSGVPQWGRYPYHEGLKFVRAGAVTDN